MSVPLSWSSTTDRISVLPKPARLGGSTGGAPNSLHSIASAVPLCAEKLHVTSSLPEASRNAPCLAALVLARGTPQQAAARHSRSRIRRVHSTVCDLQRRYCRLPILRTVVRASPPLG